jgi:hypothetical protein
MAGEVLGDRAQHVVEHWRSGSIAGIPHLARHSQRISGEKLPNYVARTNLLRRELNRSQTDRNEVNQK